MVEFHTIPGLFAIFRRPILLSLGRYSTYATQASIGVYRALGTPAFESKTPSPIPIGAPVIFIAYHTVKNINRRLLMTARSAFQVNVIPSNLDGHIAVARHRVKEFP